MKNTFEKTSTVHAEMKNMYVNRNFEFLNLAVLTVRR